MTFVNPNLPSLVHQTNKLFPMVNVQPSVQNNQFCEPNMNDAAASAPNMFSYNFGFDMVMENMAALKDALSAAQNGVSMMMSEGESIRDLLAQTQEEGVTPELLDKIQAEVEARTANIKQIRNSANFNGVNLLGGKFSLDIPDVLELMGAKDKEEANSTMTNMLASFDIDVNVEGDGFSFGGSAKIEIGYTDDGALRINIDASLDYDLSGLLDKGVSSEEAFEMVNNFINMLGVQEGDLGNAQTFLDELLGQIFNVMENKNQGALPESTEFRPEVSKTLVGSMSQKASITLDGMAFQSPNIAINIL